MGLHHSQTFLTLESAFRHPVNTLAILCTPSLLIACIRQTTGIATPTSTCPSTTHAPTVSPMSSLNEALSTHPATSQTSAPSSLCLVSRSLLLGQLLQCTIPSCSSRQECWVLSLSRSDGGLMASTPPSHKCTTIGEPLLQSSSFAGTRAVYSTKQRRQLGALKPLLHPQLLQAYPSSRTRKVIGTGIESARKKAMMGRARRRTEIETTQDQLRTRKS